MINSFDDWTASSGLVQHSYISELAGTTIAIEAAHYLNSRLLSDAHWKEKLLPALGGLPFGMKKLVEEDLRQFQAANITPLFVFSGLDTGNRDRVFQAAEDSSRVNETAWNHYSAHQAEEAVNTFGTSGSVKPEDLFRYFQSILYNFQIEFITAPYTAWAQLAYFDQIRPKVCNAIMGSSELFLYDVVKVITSWDFEDGTFAHVTREACIAELGFSSSDQFVDACMIAGNSLLATFPPLEASRERKVVKIRKAAAMMKPFNRNGYSLCLAHQEDPAVQQTTYIDKFRRARIFIKHSIYMSEDGKIVIHDEKSAPGDLHTVLGQRLPDELLFYLSRGAVGSRLLNWRINGEITELPPLDGGDSDEYRNLVRDQLVPIRTTAISVLSRSLHRFYQHTDLSLRCWFDKSNPKTISIKDLPDPTPILNQWDVDDKLIQEQKAKFSDYGKIGPIGFAVLSLLDKEFGAKTIAPPKDYKSPRDPAKALRTEDEILFNVIWRVLHLREYINAKHQLTPWGETLAAMLTSLVKPEPEHEEAVFLAVELTRLNLLTEKSMFRYMGAPARGTDNDKRNALLVSRIGCLGKLRHRDIGFTGPLSRHLLGYYSMIAAVRSSIRDLTEATLSSLLLSGNASRDLSPRFLTNIGLTMPFLLPHEPCALGIAVKSYLDELPTHADPTDAKSKLAVKDHAARRWFPECIDFAADLDTAFQLWDAVYTGIKASKDLTKNQALWDEVNTWLKERR